MSKEPASCYPVTGQPITNDRAEMRRMAEAPCNVWNDGIHCFVPMNIFSSRGMQIVKLCKCGAGVSVRTREGGL